MSETTPAEAASFTGVAGPKVAAPLKFSIAAFAAGLFAAIVFPLSTPGIGIPLIGAAIGGVALFAERRQLKTEQLVWGALALALISMTAVRTSPQLVFCILAAAGLGSLAVAGGTSWREIILNLFSVLARLPRAIGFLLRPIANLVKNTAFDRYAPVLRGLVIGVALLLLFGILFATADQAFSRLLRRLLVFLDWDWGEIPFRTFVFGATALFTGAYALGFVRSRLGERVEAAPRRFGRTEWMIALVLLDLLFVAFVIVQFTVLFGGRDHVLRTEGLIYSEYARQGFFQLLLAAALTLGVIAGTIRWGDRKNPSDRLWTRVLLGLLCASTFVVLASALKRLVLYEEAFGLTRARVTAHGLIFWLGGVFLMVVVAGAIWNARWMPKMLVAYAAGALLIFMLINPDGIIASHNIERYRATGKLDAPYLESLGEDAVPVMVRAPEAVRDCVLPSLKERLAEKDSWNEFNLARVSARKALDSVKVADEAYCRPEWTYRQYD